MRKHCLGCRGRLVRALGRVLVSLFDNANQIKCTYRERDIYKHRNTNICTHSLSSLSVFSLSIYLSLSQSENKSRVSYHFGAHFEIFAAQTIDCMVLTFVHVLLQRGCCRCGEGSKKAKDNPQKSPVSWEAKRNGSWR